MGRQKTPMDRATWTLTTLLAVSILAHSDEKPKPVLPNLRVLPQQALRNANPIPATNHEPTSYPTDPNVGRRLDEVRSLFADGQVDRGIDLVQSILDLPETSFIRDEKGSWKSARERAEQTLLDQPREVLDRYRSLSNHEADERLTRADAASDATLWGEVARRFGLTTAGLRALDRLGSFHLDRGRPELAHHYFQTLAESSLLDDSMRRSLAIKLAMVRTLVGQSKTETLPTTYRLGGREVELQKLLAEFQTPTISTQQTRDALAQLPLLTPQWQWPLTRETSLTNVIEEVVEASMTRKTPLILGYQPLLLHNRWLVRDFDGVWALDPHSGSKVSQVVSRSSIALEFRRPENRAYPMSPNPGGAECTLMANQIYGQFASDGERFFFIDNLALNPNPYLPPFINRRGADPAVERGRNTLVAVDARSLKELWRAEGFPVNQASDEDRDGFFLGPPTPLGNVLYSLAEQRGEISLLAIDGSTGNVIWREVLVVLARGIDSDVFRRSQACRIVSAGGILLCPTNLQRLIAVDPLTRRRLWDYSLIGDGGATLPPGATGQVVPPPPAAPATDPPLVVGHRVFIAEPLNEYLHAVDLTSGSTLWKAGRRGDWYIAGASTNHLITVAAQQVRGLDFVTGRVAWETPTPTPGGRGVVIGRHFLMPTADGRILAIESATGKIAREIRSQDGRPVGNLILHDDQVLTVSGEGISSYLKMTQVERDVAELLDRDPQNIVGLLRRAQLSLTASKSQQAIADLRAILREDQESTEASQARELLFDVASHEESLPAQLPDDLVADLGRFATDDGQRGTYLRLKAELLRRQAKWKESAAAIDEHLDLSLPDSIPTAFASVEQSATAWTRAFIRRASTPRPSSGLSPILARFETRLRQADSDGNVDELRRLEQILGDSALAEESSAALAKHLAARDLPAEEQIHWLRSADGSDPAAQAQAWSELALSAVRRSQPNQARFFLDRLATLPAETTSAGRSIDIIKNDLEASLPSATPTDAAWPYERIEAVSEKQYRPDPNKRLAFPVDARQPFFSSWQIVFDGQRWELEFQDRLTGSADWKLTKLPATLAYQQPLNYHQVGELMLFEQSDSVYAVSGIDRRLVWHRSFESPTTSTREVVSTSGRLRVVRTSPVASASGMMVWPKIIATGPRYCAIRAGRQLLVVDPWTGETLWARRDLRQEQMVTGDRDYLVLLTPNGPFAAHRMLTGELAREGELGKDGGSIRGVVGRRVLVLQPDRPGGKERSLRLHDPVTGVDLWSQKLTPTTEWKTADSDRLVLVDRGRRLVVINITTGKTEIQEVIEPTKDQPAGPLQVVAFSDGRRLYVVAAHQGIPGESSWPVSPSTNLRLANVHGWVRAYDLATRRLLWSRPMFNRSLVTGPGEELPYLVAVGNRMIDLGENRKRLATTVELVDKMTGQTVHTQEHDQYGTMLELAYAVDDHWIELRGYNLRIRFNFLTVGQAQTPTADELPQPASPMMRRFLQRAQDARRDRQASPTRVQQESHP
jgi:outer membrane protein assembly factor BamB